MTIPASKIVSVTPSVISSGGNALALNGVILTQKTLLPTGGVRYFASADEVSAFFGPSSAEYVQALVYFAGFTKSTVKPGRLYFAPFNLTARAAYVQGGSLAGMTLAQLQALSGSLTVVMDGYTHTAASINLSSATSFSGAASAIAVALDASEPVEAVVTGSIAGSVMTVTAITSGSLEVGQTITATGVTAGSIITAQLTSTMSGGALNGTGTYQLSATSTVSSTEITASATALSVTWDSIHSAFVVSSGITGAASTATYATGTLAASIGLTSLTGAVLSQGAAADTPATAMANVVANTTDWCSFATMWEPLLADKVNFATWTSAQNQRYAYICWDSDEQAIVNGSTECFGVVAKTAKYDGVVPVYNTLQLAVFVLGAVASIDFSRTNARITAAFKAQSGLTATCTDPTQATNLLANGYSYYGTYATANDTFTFFYNGQMTGSWLWLDTFVDQVYMNSQIQLALVELLTNVNAIPYNNKGYTLIRAALMDPINQMLNFGGIQTGVSLSEAQIAELTYQAGLDISNSIIQDGYYVQVLDPGAQVRGNRGTPVVNFWYTDGGAVQYINVASIDIL